MFEELKVTDSFRNSITCALSTGTLSHALILEGANDEVRFSAAKEIAKVLLCRSSNDQPCGTCSCCIKCEKNIHPDLHILEKEPDSTMIKVDEVRNIKSLAQVLPNEGSKSVFIIREAQFMNVQSQNALLKILEEPSKYICFILTCPSKSSFLETITSRSTAYSLGNEKADSTKDEKTLEGENIANELLSVFISSSEFYFLQKTAVFQKDKPLFKATLSAMIPIIRDALILQSGGEELISTCPDTAKRISSALTQKKVMELLAEIQELYGSVNASANHNLSITRLSAILYDIKSH